MGVGSPAFGQRFQNPVLAARAGRVLNRVPAAVWVFAHVLVVLEVVDADAFLLQVFDASRTIAMPGIVAPARGLA
jgi:hypothetical protein